MMSAKCIYEKSEQERMAEAMAFRSPMMGQIWRVGTETGLRIGDIITLDSRIFRGGSFHLREQKTAKKRKITILEGTLNDIARRMSGSNPRELCFPVSRQTVHRHIKLSAATIGLTGISCHSMRKIFAWNTYMQTFDINAVKKALNHSFMSTTILYLLGGFEWATRKTMEVAK